MLKGKIGEIGYLIATIIILVIKTLILVNYVKTFYINFNKLK